MTTMYVNSCGDFLVIEPFPGQFYAETQEEVWRHMELHAALLNQEDPAAWSVEDLASLRSPVRSEADESRTGSMMMGWVPLSHALHEWWQKVP